MKSLSTFTRGLRIVASDVAHGLFDITHNGFAMLGLAVFFAAVTLVLRPEARQLGEIQLVEWLHSRQMALGLGDVQGSERATASDPSDLPRQQATVAHWLGKKYRVAPEPLSALVAEAYELGRRARLDPTLILAVMAVESSFNPFAQSEMGAQGLMQVMTKVHGDKYEGLGGAMAAFDPLSNLRVGVKVLQECIARAGTVEGGLRIVSGRTESHLMLVDLRPKGITGKEAESVLGSAHMTINKNAIPNDPEKPMVTSGVRIGTPAMTTRGFKDEEARATAELIADVLDNPRDPANLEAVRAKVIALTSRFPVYR